MTIVNGGPSSSYYDRVPATHLDGTAIFQNEQDRRNEREVADAIEKAWQCSIHSFGQLAPIDWYAVRDGRMVGILEMKSRSHIYGTYETTLINIRKWFALTFAAVGLGVPGIFVVRFTDQIRWIPIAAVDGEKHRLANCRHVLKSKSDVAPQIEVPIADMRPL